MENADGRLKPGMFAEGRIALAEEESITVPVAAVRVDGTTRKVFVVHEGAIEERIVEVGEAKGDTVEIRRGLAKGEAVVLTPTADAADGMKVSETQQSPGSTLVPSVGAGVPPTRTFGTGHSRIALTNSAAARSGSSSWRDAKTNARDERATRITDAAANR